MASILSSVISSLESTFCSDSRGVCDPKPSAHLRSITDFSKPLPKHDSLQIADLLDAHQQLEHEQHEEKLSHVRSRRLSLDALEFAGVDDGTPSKLHANDTAPTQLTVPQEKVTLDALSARLAAAKTVVFSGWVAKDGLGQHRPRFYRLYENGSLQIFHDEESENAIEKLNLLDNDFTPLCVAKESVVNPLYFELQWCGRHRNQELMRFKCSDRGQNTSWVAAINNLSHNALDKMQLSGRTKTAVGERLSDIVLPTDPIEKQGTILKEGWVLTFVDSFKGRHWKKRWWVLFARGRLWYYKDQDKSKFLNYYDFYDTEKCAPLVSIVKTQGDKGHHFEITFLAEVQGQVRKLMLACSEKKDAEEWVSLIRNLDGVHNASPRQRRRSSVGSQSGRRGSDASHSRRGSLETSHDRNGSRDRRGSTASTQPRSRRGSLTDQSMSLTPDEARNHHHHHHHRRGSLQGGNTSDRDPSPAEHHRRRRRSSVTANYSSDDSPDAKHQHHHRRGSAQSVTSERDRERHDSDRAPAAGSDSEDLTFFQRLRRRSSTGRSPLSRRGSLDMSGSPTGDLSVNVDEHYGRRKSITDKLTSFVSNVRRKSSSPPPLSASVFPILLEGWVTEFQMTLSYKRYAVLYSNGILRLYSRECNDIEEQQQYRTRQVQVFIPGETFPPVRVLAQNKHGFGLELDCVSGGPLRLYFDREATRRTWRNHFTKAQAYARTDK